MSLVNKMLRDLDARRAAPGERTALPSAVTPLAARSEVPASRWPWLVLPAAVVLGLVAWWLGTPAPAATPAMTAAPAMPVPPAASPVSAPAATDAVPPASASESAAPSLKLDVDLEMLPPVRQATTRRETREAPPAASSPPPPPSAKPPVTASPRDVPALAAPSGEARIEKQARLPTAAERAEAEYRRGQLAQRQGQGDEAVARYQSALGEQPEHAAARQSLAALLIDMRRLDDAEEVLRKGLDFPSLRLASVTALARLKVERGQSPAALDLLLKHAAAGERSADFQGFVAALLNRAGRHHDAVERYQSATRLAPNEGRWWAGLGIALEAEGKGAEAREAYQRARGLPNLPAELAQHIDQRLR